MALFTSNFSQSISINLHVNLRFSVDEYEAVEQRPFCIQINPFSHLGDGDEDCLYLNVYTPVQSQDGLLKKVIHFTIEINTFQVTHVHCI